MTGIELRIARIRRQLRQADVAAAAGISRQRIGALERGSRVTPTSADLVTRAIEIAAGDATPAARVLPFRPRSSDGSQVLGS